MLHFLKKTKDHLHMLVGVVVVHITSGLVSLVLVGVVVVLVRARVISDITSAVGVVRAGVVVHVLTAGCSSNLDHTELGGGDSQKGAGDLLGRGRGGLDGIGNNLGQELKDNPSRWRLG